MNKFLFLLLALIPFTLQKFCFDCWGCPTYYYLACKEIRTGDGNYRLGYAFYLTFQILWKVIHLIKFAQEETNGLGAI